LTGRLLDGANATPNADGAGPNDEGVLSYGPVIFDGGSGRFVPAVWPGAARATGTQICPGATLVPWFSCTGNFQDALLDGTRSGFQDYNAVKNASGGSERDREKNILPINIDVIALKDALLDTTPGELGWYFNGSNRTFNGLIYVTQTWKNSMKGTLSAGSSFSETLNPKQGVKPSISGAARTRIVSTNPPFVLVPFPVLAFPGNPEDVFNNTPKPNSNMFLPRNLCANAEGVFSPNFAVPPCQSGSAANTDIEKAAYDERTREGARPTAVRVMNGADLRMFQPGSVPAVRATTKGLSVATPLPLYILGDWNAAARGESGNFARTMLAGDTITVLSNQWSDALVPWGADINALTPPVVGSHSVPEIAPDGSTFFTSVGVMVRAGLFTGRTRSDDAPNNQSSEDLIRNLENYTLSAGLHIRGALFIGFTSVFRNDYQEISGLLPFARTDFRYDPTLAQPALQPPGAPRFLLGVAGKWNDSR
jgi:hypothetical protein